MWNVCNLCGAYRPDKIIDPSGPYAICPECSYAHPFRRLPLLLVGGPSGAGKSAVLYQLKNRARGAVLLESDLLWRPEYNQPETRYRDFFETWLGLACNISQAGQPVVLFGAGCAVPENLENCVERRYFSQLHYLALVCDDELLITRLKARPEWRNSASPAFLERQVEFNQWLKSHSKQAGPPVELLDTSKIRVEEAARQVEAWISAKIAI